MDGISVYRGASTTLQLPVSFLSINDYSLVVSVIGGDTAVLNWLYSNKQSKESIDIRVSSTSANYSRTVSWLAIGRWK